MKEINSNKYHETAVPACHSEAPCYIISASYGNDSIALLQVAKEQKLDGVHVVYCDTGWAHSKWERRIADGEAFAANCGFTTHRIKGDETFSEMVLRKKGFPGSIGQFCSGILKGLPFLEWCEKIDPERKATVIIGKRRDESNARKDTPTHEWGDKYHEGRLIWYPLAFVTEKDRNVLIKKTTLPVLPHRSMECCPCVNANKSDLLMVEHGRIDQIVRLEKAIGKPMFRAKKKMGAYGIKEVINWARSSRGAYNKEQLFLFDLEPCVTGMCGT